MQSRKQNLIVAITTFNNEMLRISLGAIAKIHKKFSVLIFNDNPTSTLTRRDVRSFGYRGDVQIINSDINHGTFGARMEIINIISRMRNKPDWVVFCDDNDMLTNLDIPDVGVDNFAVIQNAIVLRHRVLDLLRAMDSVESLVVDDENVTITRPNVGFTGTLIRTDVLIGMANMISPHIDKIAEIDDDLDYLLPTDIVMWNFLNTYARLANPSATPIFMDTVNYIRVHIDSAATKYGRTKTPIRGGDGAIARTISRTDAIFAIAIAAAAAPSGQE